MQLRNNLYTVAGSDGAGRFDLALNPECFIYKAHFPGEPITPGVCIVATAVELLEDFLGGRSLEIARVKNVKFLSVVSPKQSLDVTFQIKKIEEAGGEVSAQFVVTSADEAKAKLSITCKSR